MKLKLLGTGAADGIPAFCSDSPVSRHARTHGGKDVRSRAAAVLDGEIKLDFGPDTLCQINREGLDPTEWSAVVFTHSDEDHLACSELQYFLHPFNPNDHLPFTIYGNEAVLAKIGARYPHWPLDLQLTKACKPFLHAAYQITPVRAMHGCGEEAHNILIERDGRRLIYATDTGIWPEETFAFTEGFGAHLLVVECTDGLRVSDYDGHLDIRECAQMVERMSRMGIIVSDARVVTTHHSHHGGTHCDLVKALSRHGIEVGYDGLEIEI